MVIVEQSLFHAEEHRAISTSCLHSALSVIRTTVAKVHKNVFQCVNKCFDMYTRK